MKTSNHSGGKIVFVTSFMPYRGSEVYVLQEALAMKRAGFEILIIPRTASGPLIGEGAQDLLANTLGIPLFGLSILTNLMLTLIRNPLSALRICKWIIESSSNSLEIIKAIAVLPKAFYLTRLLRNEHIAHIHAHSTTTVSVVAYVLSTILRVPWSAVLHSASTVDRRHYRFFRALLNSVCFLRLVNIQGKARLIELMGREYSAKLIVIHLGVNCNVSRMKAEIAGDQIRILTVANLSAQKSLDTALVSARLLLDQGISNFTWRIYGRGPLRAMLISKISNLGLEGAVRICDYIPNDRLMDLYRTNQVDIFVLTSSIDKRGSFEGIPHSMKEAMAYEIPVIGTDTGGTAELLEGGAGLLIGDRDPGALAVVIKQLIGSESLRRELGFRGRERVVDEFNIDCIIPQLKECFSDCRKHWRNEIN